MNVQRNRRIPYSTAFRPFHEMLDRYSYVAVRYKLADRTGFTKSLAAYPKSWLTASWRRANSAMIKESFVADSRNDNYINQAVLKHELSVAGDSIDTWYAYLKTPFLAEKWDWDTELAMRRARHQIASQFMGTATAELAKCHNDCTTPKERELKEERRLQRLALFVILIFFSLPFWPRIKEGFTSVDTLTEKIYQESRYGFDGAICRDGWTSHSQGRGTCSHHGGVSYYFSQDDYRMTREQARVEAHKRSWID